MRIGKRTIEPIAAARNDLFVGNFSFGNSKRKQLVGADFVAFGLEGLVVATGQARGPRRSAPSPARPLAEPRPTEEPACHRIGFGDTPAVDRGMQANIRGPVVRTGQQDRCDRKDTQHSMGSRPRVVALRGQSRPRRPGREESKRRARISNTERILSQNAPMQGALRSAVESGEMEGGSRLPTSGQFCPSLCQYASTGQLVFSNEPARRRRMERGSVAHFSISRFEGW